MTGKVAYEPNMSGNAAKAGPIVACSGATAAGGMRSRACYWNAPFGGTATFNVAANSILALLGLQTGRIVNPTEPGITDWADGTWTVRLNVTTGNMNIRVVDVYICRLNAADVNQETIGSNTGINQTLNPTGVYSFNVTGSATTALLGDTAYAVVVLQNQNAHSTQSVDIDMDQVWTTPLMVVPPRHRIEHRFDPLLRM